MKNNKKNTKLQVYFKTVLGITKNLFKLYTTTRMWLWASALTYYVTLSLVPVLSIIFGIAKGFSLDKNLLKGLQKALYDEPNLVNKIQVFVENMLAKTSGGVVSGIGVIILCYSTYRLLNNIEISMNHVWGTNYKRPLKERLPQYFMCLILAPIVMSISISLQTVMINYQKNLLDFVNHQVVVYKLLILLFTIINVLVITSIVAAFYTIMPQVKNMNFKYTFWVSLSISILYEVGTSLYFTFQAKLSNYNAVYGSFAAIPVALVWIQLSWSLILLGNGLNYLIHKHFRLTSVRRKVTLSAKDQKIFTLYVLKNIAHYFTTYNRPITQQLLYKECNIPIEFLNRIIQFLVEHKYIYTIEKKEGVYLLLGMTIEKILITDIFNQVENWSTQKIDTTHTLPHIEENLYNDVTKEMNKILEGKVIV